jgi:hypothetical protein
LQGVLLGDEEGSDLYGLLQWRIQEMLERNVKKNYINLKQGKTSSIQ